jgi:hypothetical protein
LKVTSYVTLNGSGHFTPQSRARLAGFHPVPGGARVRTEVDVKKRWKTEINLEFQEAITIRTPGDLITECPGCGKEVRMVPANEAAIIVGSTAREIYRLVEAGSIHFIEDHAGLLYVCLESLRHRISIQQGGIL